MLTCGVCDRHDQFPDLTSPDPDETAIRRVSQSQPHSHGPFKHTVPGLGDLQRSTFGVWMNFVRVTTQQRNLSLGCPMVISPAAEACEITPLRATSSQDCRIVNSCVNDLSNLRFWGSCLDRLQYNTSLYNKRMHHFCAFFSATKAAASSSAIMASMSCDTIHSFTLSNTLSSISPPATTSGRSCTSIPARWSVTRSCW